MADTVARLLALLESKGMTVFAVIDQQAAARQVGLDLRATTLVLFGNPAGGTPVMEAAPLSALDLPLKVLVWDGGDQGCQVSYTDPAVLGARYGLPAEDTGAAGRHRRADRRPRRALTSVLLTGELASCRCSVSQRLGQSG